MSWDRAMHKGDQAMLTRSSWWQQQLVPRRLRENLVVMALLHRLLETRQSQPARRQEQQSQQKTKGMKGAAWSLGEQNQSEVFVLFSCVLGSTRGCVTTGEWNLSGGKRIYLPRSVHPGSYMAPSPAFCPVCLALSPHQWINWWGICVPTPWWLQQGLALWLCCLLSTPGITQKLCAVIYSSSLCQEIAFHKVSGIFKEQSNSSLQNAAATSWAHIQMPSPARQQGAQGIDVLTQSMEKKNFCVLLNCLERSFSQQIQRIWRQHAQNWAE